MPTTHHFSFSDEDLAGLRTAQRLIRENLEGQEPPLAILAAIALRAVNSHLMATEVLSTLTNREFAPREENGA